MARDCRNSCGGGAKTALQGAAPGCGELQRMHGPEEPTAADPGIAAARRATQAESRAEQARCTADSLAHAASPNCTPAPTGAHARYAVALSDRARHVPAAESQRIGKGRARHGRHSARGRFARALREAPPCDTCRCDGTRRFGAERVGRTRQETIDRQLFSSSGTRGAGDILTANLAAQQRSVE